jgi:hypothetical protein
MEGELMAKFRRNRINPIHAIKGAWPEADVSHISLDPSLREGDFQVIREMQSDGTLIFTYQLLQKALMGIVNGNSYKKTADVDWDNLLQIKYTVGEMRMATVYGHVHLDCSKTTKYLGQRERVKMWVKCEYVYKEKEGVNVL